MPVRDIPSLEQLRQRPVMHALEASFGRRRSSTRCAPRRRPCGRASPPAQPVSDIATALEHAVTVRLERIVRRRSSGHQRDRRDHPHQPRTGAARTSGSGSHAGLASGYTNLEYDIAQGRAADEMCTPSG